MGHHAVRGELLHPKEVPETCAIRPNFIPGLCVYKFLYVWLDLRLRGEAPSRNIGWKYVLPNPLFAFIWFRTALPGTHPELRIEEFGRVT